MIFGNETMHNTIWAGNPTYLCGYLLSMILIIIKRKEYPQLFDVFISVCVGGILIVYNPWFYSFFSSNLSDGDSDAVYGRLGGVFLFVPAIICAIILISSSVTQMQFHYSAVVCIVLVMATAGCINPSRPFDVNLNRYYK